MMMCALKNNFSYGSYKYFYTKICQKTRIKITHKHYMYVLKSNSSVHTTETYVHAR